MATIILRPTAATGTSWTDATNVYDGNESTLGSVTVKSSNYSSRGLTCNFDISGLANVTSARLVVIASQSSSTSKRRITVEASVNSTTYISTKLTNTSSNTLSADITSDINNAGTVKITGKNTSTDSNTFRVYEVYIEVEYTKTDCTVTFKDTDDNIIDTQTVNNGENASLTNIYKTGKLITNLSEDYRNITSDKTIVVTYTDTQGTDINNRMLFANALYNDTDDYDLIEVDKYSLSFYPKRVYGNIGFDFLPEWGGKDITISVSEMSSNAQIIIHDYSIDDVYVALNYPNKSITINVPNDKVDSMWVCLQARDTNICWATDICILVDNEPYNVTFKDCDGTVLKAAQTGYVNLLNHYGQDNYYSFTKLNNSISNNNDWYSFYIIDFSDYIGSRLKISSTVIFNADKSINGYDAGVYSWDSNDRNTKTSLVYWTTPGTYVLDLEYFPTEESHFLSFEGGNITYSNLSITSDKNNCVDPPITPSRENKLCIGWDGDYTNVTSNLELTSQYVDEQGVNSNNALLPFTEWTGQWESIDIERKANSVSLNTVVAWGGIYIDYPSELLNKDIMFSISAMSSNALLVIQDTTDHSTLLSLTNENRNGTINLTSNSNIRIVFQNDGNAGTIWLTDLWACDVNYLPTISIAKYKFNNTIYDNLLPKFNSEFTNYTYTDEVNGNETIRTINSYHLPTLVRFENCEGLLELLYLNTSELTTLRKTFENCHNVTSINTTDWDTSNVTNMSSMFSGCESLTSLDVSNWDTSQVTDISSMFANTSLVSLDLSNWNTSKVTTAYLVFYMCSSLTSLNLSNWDTSNITNMEGMFSGCSSLTLLNLNNWNTSKVTNIKYIFENCSSLTSLDVSKWNTSNVTDMYNLFKGCSSLTSLDISNFNTSNVTSMYGMFKNCSSLTSLNLSNWTTENLANAEMMFRGCSSLNNIDLSNWNTDNLTDIDCLFYDCIKLITVNLSNWNLNNTTDYVEVFYNTPLLQEVIMYASNYTSINKVIDNLPTRTSAKQGKIYIGNTDLSSVNTSNAEAKYWTILKHKGSVINIKVGNSSVTKMLLSSNRVKNIYIGDDK